MDTSEEQRAHCLQSSTCESSGHRLHELQPLADALTIHVRGLMDVRVEQTGGGVYCVEGTLGAWTLYADENGWSLIDNTTGQSVAWGSWFADEQSIPMDEETGALYVGTCDAAAVTFAAALEQGGKA